MNKTCICKACNNYVSDKDFYHQGGICKKCRSEKSKSRIENLTGSELAENLLHKSCIRAIERVKRNEKEAYKGVKCDWTKPKKMKIDLMNNGEFWGQWVEQSRIYEENNRVFKLRPTIDRIESDVKKGGHYTMENIQMLAYGENTIKANAVKCKVIFLKDLKFVKIVDYGSMKEVMKELNIPAYSTVNPIKDSGKLHNIGNGYSILIQTQGGMLKEQDSPLYKIVVTNKKILIDYFTGKEYVINSNQYSFDNYGIWVGENQVTA